MRIRLIKQIGPRALLAAVMQLGLCTALTSAAHAQVVANIPADATVLDGSQITAKFQDHSFTIKPYKGMHYWISTQGAGRKYTFVSFDDEALGSINFQITMFVGPTLTKPQLATLLTQSNASRLQKQMTQSFIRPLELPTAAQEKASGYEFGGRMGANTVDVFIVGVYKPGVICELQGTNRASAYPAMRKKLMAMIATFKLLN